METKARLFIVTTLKPSQPSFEIVEVLSNPFPVPGTVPPMLPTLRWTNNPIGGTSISEVCDQIPAMSGLEMPLRARLVSNLEPVIQVHGYYQSMCCDLLGADTVLSINNRHNAQTEPGWRCRCGETWNSRVFFEMPIDHAPSGGVNETGTLRVQGNLGDVGRAIENMLVIQRHEAYQRVMSEAREVLYPGMVGLLSELVVEEINAAKHEYPPTAWPDNWASGRRWNVAQRFAYDMDWVDHSYLGTNRWAIDEMLQSNPYSPYLVFILDPSWLIDDDPGSFPVPPDIVVDFGMFDLVPKTFQYRWLSHMRVHVDFPEKPFQAAA